jgi:DNA-binding Xre family transcriptional regulator
MLVFNLSRIMALRGVNQRFGFLVNRGFHRTIANNLANDRALNIKLAHMEKLCRLLNCTPNDLFEWKPDQNETLGETHALHALKREKTAPRISPIMKEIPLEKLDRIEDLPPALP